MLPVVRYAWSRLPKVRGWEADDIARNIVQGRGFSFSGNERWLWDKWNTAPGESHPTAWVDPVFTYILAGAHALFGEHAYAAMYALVFACIAVIFLCGYLVAARFGSGWTGVLAVGLMALHFSLYKSFLNDVTNSALAAAVMMMTMLVAVRYFENSSRPRLVALGLMSGLLVLTCPAAQYFIIAISIAVAWHHRRNWAHALPRAFAVALLAGCVIAPWTLRNYMTFGEFVLVRNGAGQIAWDSTVGPAETFMPGAALTVAHVPWQSSGPRDAVRKMTDKEWRLPMHRFQIDSMTASPPPGYAQMNEAQRDHFYLSRTIEFLAENPGIATAMAIAKLEVLVGIFGAYGLIIFVLALIGAILLAHDRRSWPLSLAIAAYCAPFTLIIAYYGRYRAPIEPVLAVLAAAGLAATLTRLWNQKRSPTNVPV